MPQRNGSALPTISLTQRRLLQAVADGRFFQRISSRGAFEMYEQPPRVRPFSAEERAWILLPKFRTPTFKWALHQRLITQDGPLNAERWAKFRLTPRGAQTLLSAEAQEVQP